MVTHIVGAALSLPILFGGIILYQCSAFTSAIYPPYTKQVLWFLTALSTAFTKTFMASFIGVVPLRITVFWRSPYFRCSSSSCCSFLLFLDARISPVIYPIIARAVHILSGYYSFLLPEVCSVPHMLGDPMNIVQLILISLTHPSHLDVSRLPKSDHAIWCLPYLVSPPRVSPPRVLFLSSALESV